MNTHSLSQQPTATNRIAAIDLFRFAILFLMVQGHVFRALLRPALRQGEAFRFHEIFHGAVAPGFLFSAGFVAYLSFMRKQGIVHTMWSRIRKALFVIALGYWIHLPFFSLRKSLEFIGRRQADSFFSTDVLQCIGISLILFALISYYFPREKPIVWSSAFLMAFFFSLARATNGIHIHFSIDPYLRHELSFFPLFPWSGFLFLGILTAFLYKRQSAKHFFWTIAIAGIVLIPWLMIKQDMPKTELTVAGLCNKAGTIYLMLAGALALTPLLKGRVLKFLNAVGQETLFFYVLHLFVIFGSILNDGLQQFVGETLTIGTAIFWSMILELAIFTLTWMYHWLKSAQRLIWRLVFYLFWAVFLYMFITRPF